jgi:hypothetical protein
LISLDQAVIFNNVSLTGLNVKLFTINCFWSPEVFKTLSLGRYGVKSGAGVFISISPDVSLYATVV